MLPSQRKKKEYERESELDNSVISDDIMMLLIRTSPDGRTLTVIRAHTNDSGKYTCVATNTAGEEDRIFNLNVYGGFHFFC